MEPRATVSVVPTLKAIIPAAVGVDIGCGMNALRLSLRADQLPDNLAALRAQIERDVPVGFAGHADDRRCEDGLARVAAGLGPVCNNPFQSILVRAVETLYAIEEAIRIIDAFEPELVVRDSTGPALAQG